MRRLRTADVVLLVSLLTLWVAWTVLHVKQVASGQLAWVGVYVSGPSGGDEFDRARLLAGRHRLNISLSFTAGTP